MPLGPTLHFLGKIDEIGLIILNHHNLLLIIEVKVAFNKLVVAIVVFFIVIGLIYLFIDLCPYRFKIYNKDKANKFFHLL